MVDFPSAPAANQTFTAGNRSWRFNGSGWERTITASHVHTVISATVAEVVFDIPIAWKAVRLTAVGMRSTSVADILLQWRRSGQGTYDNANTNYKAQYIGRSTVDAVNTIQSGTSSYNAAMQIGALTDSGVSPRCTIDGMLNTGTSTTNAAYVGLSCSTNTSSNEGMYTFCGRSDFTGSLDRIRIYPHIGSLNSGTISIQRII